MPRKASPRAALIQGRYADVFCRWRSGKIRGNGLPRVASLHGTERSVPAEKQAPERGSLSHENSRAGSARGYWEKPPLRISKGTGRNARMRSQAGPRQGQPALPRVRDALGRRTAKTPVLCTLRVPEGTWSVLRCTLGVLWGHFRGAKTEPFRAAAAGPYLSQETALEALVVPPDSRRTAKIGGVFTLPLYIGGGKNPRERVRCPVPEEPETRDRTFVSQLNCQRLTGALPPT